MKKRLVRHKRMKRSVWRSKITALLVGGLLLTGCANQGGLLGTGLYKTTISGPLAREGMTAAEVEYVMGPSWQVLHSGRGSLWRYGVNILGMVSPTCDSGRGGSIMCLDVFFFDGRVSNVTSY